MAFLPPIKTLDASDAPDAPWAKKLYSAVSQFMTGVVTALSNGLTVQNNMAAQVNDVRLYISDSQTSLSFPFSFNWRFPGNPPQGCIVVRIDATDGSERVLSAVMPRWQYRDGQVMVTALRGHFKADAFFDVRFYTFA